MTARNLLMVFGGITFARMAHSTLGGKFCAKGKGVGRAMLCLSFVSWNCRGVPNSTFCLFGGFSNFTSELGSESLHCNIDKNINIQEYKQ